MIMTYINAYNDYKNRRKKNLIYNILDVFCIFFTRN